MLTRSLFKAQSAQQGTRTLSTSLAGSKDGSLNYALIGGSFLAGLIALKFAMKKREAESWLFRDDIGAPNGIKGYEEQVNSVGTIHGNMYWPSEVGWQTYNSATLRRGFKVFTRVCQGCHGAIHKKYDLLIDKGFTQRELMDKMVFLQKLHPAHQKYKGDYFQEWDYRQRVIHDRMWPPYFTMHQAKNANGGLWPKDLSKVYINPGMINHVYNVMTGYGYKPPIGVDVPEGKFFNPYFDHMIVGMPPQLFDGMIEYEDGTKASIPQMAHDVSEYLQFVGRARGPDFKVVLYTIIGITAFYYPLLFMFNRYHFINIQSSRFEVYALKSGGYKKFREKMWKTAKIPENIHGIYT